MALGLTGPGAVGLRSQISTGLKLYNFRIEVKGVGSKSLKCLKVEIQQRHAARCAWGGSLLYVRLGIACHFGNREVDERGYMKHRKLAEIGGCGWHFRCRMGLAFSNRTCRRSINPAQIIFGVLNPKP